MNTNGPIGLIFDVDGTIWDSTGEVAICWTEVVRMVTDLDRVITKETLMREFGQTMDVIMDHLFPELPLDKREDFSQALYQLENERMLDAPCHVYEGILDTMKKLSERYPLFIVSNCQSGYIEAMLVNTQMGAYIKDTLCYGDNPVPKGDNIRLLMEKNGLEKALYIGDTAGDQQAADAAGIPFIFAEYGFGETDSYVAKIESPIDLLSLDYEALVGAL